MSPGLFPDGPISALEKLHCARRELKLRQRVYPKWVANGRMSEDEAARQIKVMQAILLDYQEQVARDYRT